MTVSLRPAFPWLVVLTLLALAPAVPGCSSSGDSSGGNSSKMMGGKNLNVLLIVVDTMAARHLGCFTPGLKDSPTIDRLAREGVLFRHAYSTAPWTQPAVASLFTSRMPSEVGMTQIFSTLADSFATLPELMRDRGRWTMGVTSNWIVVDKFGFGQGFEKLNESPVGGHDAITSDKVTDAAKLVLDRAGKRPFFLYVHYFDPHWYYNHHPEFDETSGYTGSLRSGEDIGEIRKKSATLTDADIAYLEGLYREEIAYTDDQIGKLLAHLQELGLADDTLVVVAADHGEEFREHGWIGHTANLYDNLIHVPLIFWMPGRLQPHEVDATVSLLDVLPTLDALTATGTPTPAPQRRGKSLVGYLDSSAPEVPGRPLFAEVSYTSPDGWPSGDDQVKTYFMTALRVGRWKAIHDLQASTWTLFDLKADPDEQHGNWNGPADVQKDLQDMLTVWENQRGSGAAITTAPLDAEAVKKLKSLGYVR